MEKKKFQYADHFAAAALRNRVTIRCYSIFAIVLFLAYLIEVLKKSRSVASFLVIVLFSLVTEAAVLVPYIKQKDTKVTKYAVVLGTSVIYAYVTFTSDVRLTFCYIFLFIVLSMVYSDMKVTYAICGFALAINIALTIKLFAEGRLANGGLEEVEIIIACVGLVSMIAIMTSDCINKINTDRFDSMDEKEKQVNDLLGATVGAAKEIAVKVERVSQEMGELNSSISLTKASMEEVVVGVNETTDSVQTQQIKTEEIGANIETVEQITEAITIDVKKAEQLVSNGKELMDNLIKQVNESDSASKIVANEMDTLRENANNMQEILSLINTVAAQTGLLALNASIEAARAGEAGKGFAVVAGEISNLANQTKEATANISSLIQNIDDSLEQVEESVEHLVNSNEVQNEYVEKTATNFEEIHTSTENIAKQSNELTEMVSKVSTANQTIVESIQNISAISEEMTARANETMDSSQKDTERVDRKSVV